MCGGSASVSVGAAGTAVCGCCTLAPHSALTLHPTPPPRPALPPTRRCCPGRIVSALEGGYRIQGGIVSAFARSVAAHMGALAEPNAQAWDPADAKVRIKS